MNEEQRDRQWMQLALAQAEIAAAKGEVPVGAVLVLDDNLVAAAGNAVERSRDATQHAEMLVIKQASIKLNAWRLLHTTLYCTLEPCPMCQAAINLARIPKLVFAAKDTQPHAYQVPSIHNGVCAAASRDLLQKFFQARRHG